ncbi:MFS transporter [Ochrobactrum sp. XJ1]|nr:MFS transporter [Ochrobactrum sp. XJ1]
MEYRSHSNPFISRGTWEFRRVAISMVAAGFSTFALMNCVQPLMPVFSQAYGITAADAALSLSVNIAVLAICMPVTSAFSEVVGRKSVMVVSLFLSGLLILASAYETNWSTFLIYRALQGVAMSGVPAVAMAYLSEEIDPKQAGYAIGLYVSGAAIGGMIGRVMTGIVLDYSDWHVAVLSIGIAGMITAAAFTVLLPASRHFVRQGVDPVRILSNYAAHLRNPAQRRLYVTGFLLMGGLITVYNNLGYRLLAEPFTLSQTIVSLLFSIYIAGIVSSPMAGAMADRFGRRKVLLISLGVTVAGALAMLFDWLPLVLGGLVVFTIGFFASHAVASGWVGREATQARAQASSLYLFSYYMGGAIISWFGGLVWDYARWPGITALLALCLVICLWLASIRSQAGST